MKPQQLDELEAHLKKREYSKSVNISVFFCLLAVSTASPAKVFVPQKLLPANDEQRIKSFWLPMLLSITEVDSTESLEFLPHVFIRCPTFAVLTYRASLKTLAYLQLTA